MLRKKTIVTDRIQSKSGSHAIRHIPHTQLESHNFDQVVFSVSASMWQFMHLFCQLQTYLDFLGTYPGGGIASSTKLADTVHTADGAEL